MESLLRGGAGPRSTIEHPLEHLVACHGRIEERLQTMERAAACFETRTEEARNALESCFRYFETSGVLHTADEEESVFPRLRCRLDDAEAKYVPALEEQHREADRIYSGLKELPDAASAAGMRHYRELVARFCALYRAHIASENSELIAAARRLLTPGELSEISREMWRRRR